MSRSLHCSRRSRLPHPNPMKPHPRMTLDRDRAEGAARRLDPRHTRGMKATDLAAIISAIGGVAVAAIAIIVAARSTKISVQAQERTTEAALSAQRDIAADERLWHRRAEVYVQLLEWAEVINRQNTLFQMDPDAPVAVSDVLRANTRVFASQAVLDKLEDVSKTYSEYMQLLKDGSEGTGAEVYGLAVSLQGKIKQLTESVRAEILEHRARVR
jgi:hypothetical protein